MSYYGYILYEAERTRSPAEQRSADDLLGQCSAALARLFRSLARPARALRRQPGTAGGPTPAQVPATTRITDRTPWTADIKEPRRHAPAAAQIGGSARVLASSLHNAL
jgi:hypothetical protein